MLLLLVVVEGLEKVQVLLRMEALEGVLATKVVLVHQLLVKDMLVVLYQVLLVVAKVVAVAVQLLLVLEVLVVMEEMVLLLLLLVVR
tara:strand:- start:20 stop:280 length:261 start_codon:yes stop_codon:yes gene_type:complete